MKRNIEISTQAKEEIASQILYYESLIPGLGRKFVTVLLDHFRMIQRFPFAQIRYAKVRCVPVSNYPFMIHYSISESDNTILIHALVHTSRNPAKTWNKKDWNVSEEVMDYGAYVYHREYYYAA